MSLGSDSESGTDREGQGEQLEQLCADLVCATATGSLGVCILFSVDRSRRLQNLPEPLRIPAIEGLIGNPRGDFAHKPLEFG